MIDALGRPMAPFGHHPFAFRTAFGRPAHTFESRSLIDTGPPPAPQPRSRRSPPVLHTSMRTPRSRTDAENKCNKPNVLARPSVTKSPRAVDAWMPSPTSAAEHARSLLQPRKLPVPVYAPSTEIGTLRALHAGRPKPESGSRPSTARSACSAPAHASGGVSRHTASSTRRQASQAAHITPSGIEARFRPKPPPPRPSSSPVFRRPMLRTAVEERVVVERSASVVTESPQPPVRSEAVDAHVHVLVESTRIGEFPVAQVKIFFSPEERVANVVQAFWRSCITRKSWKAEDRQKRAEMAAAKIARMWQQRVQAKRQQFDRWREQQMSTIRRHEQFFERMRAQLEHDCATSIQRGWRTCSVRRYFLAAVQIQREWRARRLQLNAMHAKKSAFRPTLGRELERQHFRIAGEGSVVLEEPRKRNSASAHTNSKQVHFGPVKTRHRNAPVELQRAPSGSGSRAARSLVVSILPDPIP